MVRRGQRLPEPQRRHPLLQRRPEAPAHHRAGRALTVQAVLLAGTWDTQCGCKLFRGDVAREVFAGLTTDGFGYDPEVLYLAKKKGVRIAEVPVVWRNSAPTKVMPIRSSMDMFGHVVSVRLGRGARSAARP